MKKLCKCHHDPICDSLKDAEEAAKAWVMQTQGWSGPSNNDYLAKTSFTAGWQAKESREAELMSLLERAKDQINFLETCGCNRIIISPMSVWLADFYKMKWKK